jgi:hypothetical protein
MAYHPAAPVLVFDKKTQGQDAGDTILLISFFGVPGPGGIIGMTIDVLFGLLNLVLNLMQAFFELGQTFAKASGNVRQLFAEYQQGNNKNDNPFPSAGHSQSYKLNVFDHFVLPLSFSVS